VRSRSIVQKYVEDIVLVSDSEIRETMRYLITRMKMLVEPSGAVPPAALFHHKLPASLGKTGVIVSGGNVDLEFFQLFGIESAVVMNAK